MASQAQRSKAARALASIGIEKGGAFVVPDDVYPDGWVTAWEASRRKRISATLGPKANITEALAQEDARTASRARAMLAEEQPTLADLPGFVAPEPKRKPARKPSAASIEAQALRARVLDLEAQLARVVAERDALMTGVVDPQGARWLASALAAIEQEVSRCCIT